MLEFAMIDMTHPSSPGLWLLLLAAIFTIAVFASHTAFKKARRDTSIYKRTVSGCTPSWKTLIRRQP